MNTQPEQWQGSLLRVLRSLNITFAKDLSWSASRTVWPHTHDFYQMDYFYSGSGRVVIAGQEYTVRAHDLYITNPEEEHEFRAASSQPMEGIVFKFEVGGSGGPVFPNYVGNLSRLSRMQQFELENLMRRACAEINKPGAESGDLAAAFLSVFFGLMLRYIQDVDDLLRAETETTLGQRILSYIGRHYDRHITLVDLSRVAQLDPGYLCSKFSREIGMSPMAALTNVRVDAARNLLVNTRLPISQVGVRVGYPDPYHFSRRFKQVAGVSPKEYREQFEQVPVDLPPPPPEDSQPRS